MDCLEDDFKMIVRERELENRDRVNFQKQSARRHLARQKLAIQQRIDTLRERENERMISLQLAQLRNLEKRFQTTEEGYKGKLELDRHQFDVCFGVLNLK